MNNPKELSIVILCYRSEELIIDFCRRVKQLAKTLTERYEIIMVANYLEGSKDRTKEIVENLAAKDDKIIALCKKKEGMMGWDMRMGMEKASGNLICVIDGDGQFSLESIVRCYNEIKSEKYDLVKTYRIKRYDGFYRILISRLYNVIFSMLFPNLMSKDINSKPKILTRKAYERLHLTSDDWFIDAEIMINVRRNKMTFFEFPIEFEKLEGRTSFIKFPAIFEFLRNLIMYRVREYGKGRTDG